jgi:hypothetical protein
MRRMCANHSLFRIFEMRQIFKSTNTTKHNASDVENKFLVDHGILGYQQKGVEDRYKGSYPEYIFKHRQDTGEDKLFSSRQQCISKSEFHNQFSITKKTAQVDSQIESILAEI